MKAIILAAGRGSRMGSATDSTPKCLTKLNGTPLLDIQINALSSAGLSEIGIVTGYMSEKLSDRGLHTFHNPYWEQTNMLTSLTFASDWLRSDECIVSYSDIFYDDKPISYLMASTDDIAITYDPEWLKIWRKRFNDPLSDAETFRIDKLSGLVEIGQKPKTLNEIQGQYMGLLKFSPDGWSVVELIKSQVTRSTFDKMHMTDLLQKIIENNLCSIRAIASHCRWGEVDTVSDLAVYDTK